MTRKQQYQQICRDHQKRYTRSRLIRLWARVSIGRMEESLRRTKQWRRNFMRLEIPLDSNPLSVVKWEVEERPYLKGLYEADV